VLKRYGFSAAPIIMGLVLGGMVENTLKQSLIIFDHDWLRFLERPIVVTFLLFTLVSVSAPLIGRQRARQRASRAPAAPPA
jgi:putative tricarboxylic transport membrane protein